MKLLHWRKIDEDDEVEEEVMNEDIEPLSNTVEWKDIPEIVSNLEGNSSSTQLKPVFLNEIPVSFEPIDFFRMFFPYSSLKKWVVLTNANIAKERNLNHNSTVTRNVTEEELERWMGIRLQIVLLGGKECDFYWHTKDSQYCLTAPYCFGETRHPYPIHNNSHPCYNKHIAEIRHNKETQRKQ